MLFKLSVDFTSDGELMSSLSVSISSLINNVSPRNFGKPQSFCRMQWLSFRIPDHTIQRKLLINCSNSALIASVYLFVVGAFDPQWNLREKFLQSLEIELLHISDYRLLQHNSSQKKCQCESVFPSPLFVESSRSSAPLGTGGVRCS